ncbi:MAG: Rne/Rng family ribonuclease, partial [Candidatus Latescibacteria bacterium]|nr:Rne/Rng family ribonuclease [Candidatus Latescibacterota bacterium]
MRKDIIINANPHEIRIGIREDGELVELLIERADSKRIVGNLYRGVVTSVKPGLQAAFVDIGLERAGFLHASDLVHEDPESVEAVDGPLPAGGGRSGRNAQVPDIGDMLKVGDKILVQVTKEPISSKGPRLTADISLPGRYLVYMPKGHHVGVSRKIEDRRERVRLKRILQEARPDAGAFIVRTAAEEAEEKAIRADVKYLSDLWLTIETADREALAPALVHEDVGMVVGLIRDIFKEDVDQLVIDDKEDFKRLQKYVQIFAPDIKDRVRLHRDTSAIFDHYDIEQEIRKSTEPKVWMKKGGYIVIEQTEALVSIDVNTGRFVGRHNQEDTIVETNMLAAREVARQLRLRDIGGIIVVDFIDMESEGNKKRVLNELRNSLKNDRARTKVFPVSNLGLAEMSRQRVRPSLVSFLSDDCPYCHGAGKVLSLETLANRIEREVHRVHHKTGERQLQIVANPMLALYLASERAEQLDDLCREHDMIIDVTDDPGLHRENYQVLSLKSDRDLIQEAEKRLLPRGRGNRGHVTAQPAAPGRERHDRGERPARPDRAERFDRGERPARADLPERSDRPERPDPEQSDVRAESPRDHDAGQRRRPAGPPRARPEFRRPRTVESVENRDAGEARDGAPVDG